MLSTVIVILSSFISFHFLIFIHIIYATLLEKCYFMAQIVGCSVCNK